VEIGVSQNFLLTVHCLPDVPFSTHGVVAIQYNSIYITPNSPSSTLLRSFALGSQLVAVASRFGCVFIVFDAGFFC